jgi:hypothetical protein
VIELIERSWWSRHGQFGGSGMDRMSRIKPILL